MTVTCVCVCVLGRDQREKVCRAGCRRTTEAGAGSSQSWGLSVVDGRLGLCKGDLPGAPPGGARSEDPDGRTGGCIDCCPFSIPCLWETCSDSPASLEAWFFQRACWWEVSGHRRVGRDGDRTMAKADSPTAATGPAEASPGCLALKLSFGTNLGHWAHCFRASAAQPQSRGLPEDPKSGLAVALKGSAGCTGSKALREEACLLTRHGYNRKKWYVST